ncbi:MAG TPA: UvrD-helicase domain-containing protein, partial [Kineosporiaceae bacterium]|nr:UvrD-helicase domain-containing protein [Kineosporiaceae bacterium]
GRSARLDLPVGGAAPGLMRRPGDAVPRPGGARTRPGAHTWRPSREGPVDEEPTRRRALTAEDLQHELDAEQAYVGTLYAQLDVLRARAEQALQEVRRAPVVPTPAGRAERDAFDAWHSERLARLSSVEDRLAFGRLDLADGARRYVGRLGLSDDAQQQLLIDWRAPAASAFYQATAAAPQGVARRRHLATKGRAVVGLDDELLDADALERNGLAVVAGEGALLSALTAHRTGRMRDIVATLQAEQDRIVRAPLAGVLVVQGGPGTGKTAVALHRAAYLLYTHRERIARSGVLVVGPTPVFLRYIEQVLPSLGESGVVLLTPGQLFPDVDATAVERPEVAVVKGDLRMADVVRNAVRNRQRTPARPVPIDVQGDRIAIRPGVVADARGRARQGGRPHNEARTTFVRHVLDDLATQLAQARGLDAGEDRADLLAELRAELAVRREVNLLWMPLTAQRLVEDLFARPERLAAAAGGILSAAEQRLLRREKGAPWTVSDVPLLDEAAELIGADVTALAAAQARGAEAARARAEALEFAGKVLEQSPDAYANMTPTAEMLADRFEAGTTTAPLAERAREDRSWTFGHAVVDEAQELSPMQWRLLARRVPVRSMTVVGDVAQTGSAAGATAWGDVLDTVVEGRWRLEELTVNYRTPAEVMDLATALLEAHGVAVKPARSAR